MRNLCPLLIILFLLTAASPNTTDESPYLTITGNSTYRAEPGENVTLLCLYGTDNSMELHHLTIRWTKDGSTKWLFNGTSSITAAERDDLYDNKAKLHLSHVQKEDGGTYSCTIHYRGIEKSHVSTLTVEDLNDIFQKPTALTSNTTEDKYRTVKMMLVVGALVTTYCVSLLIFFFVVV